MPANKKASTARKQAPATKSAAKHAPPPPSHSKEKEPKPGKHSGKKDVEKHENGKHLRRAYEHLGRVEALAAAGAAASIQAINTLLEAAQHQIDSGDSHAAADLLRAAEHLGFAALAGAATGSLPAVTSELEHAIHREFAKRAKKAEEHEASKRSTVGQLARETLKNAHAALGRSSFREALELVRAAEALAEIDPADVDTGSLDTSKRKKLKHARSEPQLES